MDSSNYSTPLIPEEVNQQQKQSPLGTASLFLSILTILGVCLTLGISVYSTKLPSQTEEDVNIIVGLIAVGTLAIGLVGIGLGIAGLFQNRHRKTFAISGLVLSTAAFLVLCGVMALGMAMIGTSSSAQP